MNLIPETPCKTPNYWCTWSSQNTDCAERGMDKAAQAPLFEGDQGAQLGRNWLNEDIVFKKGGWSDKWPSIRRDLYFLLDDGWDVPYNVHPDKQLHRFGSVELSEERFPSCKGSPAERLKKLNARLKAEGWRGLGLWIASQAAGDGLDGKMLDDATLERYWRERLSWCHEAGVEYWKIDWGQRGGDVAFCKMLTALAKECAPKLLVEQPAFLHPVNGIAIGEDGVVSGSGRLDDGCSAVVRTAELLKFSDVIRLYDTLTPFTDVSMLERLSYVLLHAKDVPGGEGLLNVEDSLYLGAATGSSIGVMRAPHKVPSPYEAASHRELRLTEVVRAVRWQRLAPAFGVGRTSVAASDEILFDEWLFKEGEIWYGSAVGKSIRQGAPASLTRGLPLPTVQAKSGAVPFVVASRNPDNGAVSVATIARLDLGRRALTTPLVDVSISCPFAGKPVGVFGEFASLTLDNGTSLAGVRVFAQDLASDTAEDITGQVRLEGPLLTLSGDLLKRLGTQANGADDRSEPGLVLLAKKA